MTSGIQNAKGQAILNPLPDSWLNKPTAPIAQSPIGSLLIKQTKISLAQLAYTASSWNNMLINSELATIGKYQFNSMQLESLGYLNSQIYARYTNETVFYSAAWTGLSGIVSLPSLLINNSLQDNLALELMATNLSDMLLTNTILSSDDISTQVGVLFVAHLIGAGQPESSLHPQGTGAYGWRKYGISTNANTIGYFNAGRYSVLQLGK